MFKFLRAHLDRIAAIFRVPISGTCTYCGEPCDSDRSAHERCWDAIQW
jgi:hypothetical protein